MRTLHLYLLRQAVSTLAMTVCVFAVLLLLASVLKDILPLLVTRHATAIILGKMIVLLLPWIMAWVLPFALLAAMLLLFGRLSADNELTAVRASGISLLSLVTPLLLLGLAMSGLCALFNLKVTPESRATVKRLSFELIKNADLLITEDRFIDEIPNTILYFRKRNGDVLEDICLYKLEKNEITSRITAARGRIIWGAKRETIAFEFENALTEQLYWRDEDVREAGPVLPATNLLGENPLASIISNAPPGRVFGRMRIPEWRYAHAGSAQTDPADVASLTMRSDRAVKLSEKTFAQLRADLPRLRQQGINVTPVLVHMHRQVAFSFASFAFTLVAIPLGIRAHRRETSIGMALALILAVIYYSFLIVSQALQSRPHLAPHLIVWIPNVLFQLLGVWLLFRANRKG